MKMIKLIIIKSLLLTGGYARNSEFSGVGGVSNTAKNELKKELYTKKQKIIKTRKKHKTTLIIKIIFIDKI